MSWLRPFGFALRCAMKLAPLTLLCLHSTCFAESASTADLVKSATQLDQIASAVFTQAIDLKQSINDFNSYRAPNTGATQLAIYVSLKSGGLTPVQNLAIEITLDGSALVSGTYNAKELASLASGSSAQLYLGQIASGRHDLVMLLRMPDGKTYASNVGAIRLDKSAELKIIELAVEFPDKNAHPLVVLKEHS